MLLFYTDTITPRIQYIVDFFSEELFDDPIRITNNKEAFLQEDGPRLNYSDRDFSEKEFFIQPSPLLFQKDIREQPIECFELNFHKAFFATRGDFPFDILAASFYLLSRYEEYLPHYKDEYGRYDYNQSLAFKEGFLRQPLINIWISDFKKALQRKFPQLIFHGNSFRCLLTYDVDMAYCYKHKGLVRNAGGFFRSVLKGEWKMVKERWRVLSGLEKDPFDCFEWLDALHLYCRIKPYFFFLVAKQTSKYDKNSSADGKSFRQLIEYYATNYKAGIHPSWQSGDDPRLLKEETEWMEAVTDKPVMYSRQHYIRLSLPHTYRHLIANGIEKDFSMGYGSINGFRASVCSSFYWYDLEKEERSSLWLYPFCFMDANSFFEQKYTPKQTYEELMEYYNLVKKYNGIFISVWHNHMLGTTEQFTGWRQMFELFMKETVYWDAYYDEG